MNHDDDVSKKTEERRHTENLFKYTSWLDGWVTF